MGTLQTRRHIFHHPSLRLAHSKFDSLPRTVLRYIDFSIFRETAAEFALKKSKSEYFKNPS